MAIAHRIDYAISADRESWVGRIERGCAALEAACPWGRLTNSRQAEKPNKPVLDRQRYLRTRLKHSAWLFNLDNGRYGGIGRGGEHVDNRYVQVGGRFNEVSKTVYDFLITFQTETFLESEPVFVSVGDAVDAYSAMSCPFNARERLGCYQSLVSGRLAFLSRQENMRASAEARMREGEKLQADLAAIGRQLPRFSDDLLATRDHPAQPKDLGWINYWSAQTCEYLGFPATGRDRDLLEHSYRTPGGAWLVKLCSEPLDLSRPEHLGIFADTYARFPKLGMRAT